jgi:hypothetical protein
MAKKLGLPEPGQRRALTQGEAVTMRAGAGDWEVGCTREGECYVWRDGCPHEERVDEAYIELLEEYWGDRPLLDRWYGLRMTEAQWDHCHLRAPSRRGVAKYLRSLIDADITGHHDK